LFKHAIEVANEQFIPICDGIEGTLGLLVINENYKNDLHNVPIDIMLNMQNIIADEEEECN
jgi:hypothetical protein